MLDLHPDNFKVEWARILLAAGIEPVTPKQLQNAIETRFGKHYPLFTRVEDKVHEGPLTMYIRQLIERGLMEEVGPSKLTLSVTGYGLEHVGMIEFLARTKPNPYRKFTRRSYSPNCDAKETTSPEADIPIPAPASWGRLATLNSGTW